LGQRLVRTRVAACVNILDGLESFTGGGRENRCHSNEVVLIAKTLEEKKEDYSYKSNRGTAMLPVRAFLPIIEEIRII